MGSRDKGCLADRRELRPTGQTEDLPPETRHGVAQTPLVVAETHLVVVVRPPEPVLGCRRRSGSVDATGWRVAPARPPPGVVETEGRTVPGGVGVVTRDGVTRPGRVGSVGRGVDTEGRRRRRPAVAQTVTPTTVDWDGDGWGPPTLSDSSVLTTGSGVTYHGRGFPALPSRGPVSNTGSCLSGRR